MSVYIPTCGRIEMLKKTVPWWIEQELGIRLVVKPEEYDEHVNLRDSQGWRGPVSVLRLPRRYSKGIAASRRFCIEHAARMGYTEIIMSDDDHRPSNGTDAGMLLDAVRDHPDALGVGSVCSMLDRFHQGRLSQLHEVILCPSGWGLMVSALNVQNVISLGNFDVGLTYQSDTELMRNGITRGMPWLIHCDVWVTSVGKRFAPGGIAGTFNSIAERDAEMARCLRLIESRWPRYQRPMKDGVRSRMYWAKMRDDYTPGWRELSALHGGSLD